MVGHLAEQGLRFIPGQFHAAHVRFFHILVRCKERILDQKRIGLGHLAPVNAYYGRIAVLLIQLQAGRAGRHDVPHFAFRPLSLHAAHGDFAADIADGPVILDQQRVVAQDFFLERHNPCRVGALPVAHIAARELHILVFRGNAQLELADGRAADVVSHQRAAVKHAIAQRDQVEYFRMDYRSGSLQRDGRLPGRILEPERPLRVRHAHGRGTRMRFNQAGGFLHLQAQPFFPGHDQVPALRPGLAHLEGRQGEGGVVAERPLQPQIHQRPTLHRVAEIHADDPASGLVADVVVGNFGARDPGYHPGRIAFKNGLPRRRVAHIQLDGGVEYGVVVDNGKHQAVVGADGRYHIVRAQRQRERHVGKLVGERAADGKRALRLGRRSEADFGERGLVNLGQALGLVDHELDGAVGADRQETVGPYDIARHEGWQVELARKFRQNHFAVDLKRVLRVLGPAQGNNQERLLRVLPVNAPVLYIRPAHLRDIDLRGEGNREPVQAALDHAAAQDGINVQGADSGRGDHVGHALNHALSLQFLDFRLPAHLEAVAYAKERRNHCLVSRLFMAAYVQRAGKNDFKVIAVALDRRLADGGQRDCEPR